MEDNTAYYKVKKERYAYLSFFIVKTFCIIYLLNENDKSIEISFGKTIIIYKTKISMNNVSKANISMVISKTFGGLNMNALKYLLPLWMTPISGTMLRCVFGAIVFWTISIFKRPDDTAAPKEKLLLFSLGAIFLYGYMLFFVLGLNNTTPVSASIFSSLQPIWVFLLTIFFFKAKATPMKYLGIAVGLAGALLCTLTQKSDDLASDPMKGNLFCLLSSFSYAGYLILTNRVLKNVGIFTMLKYVFTGAAFSSIVLTLVTEFKAPVLSMPLDSTPFLILFFVLIFPTILSNILVPIGLKYLDTTTVAIYGYLVLIVATVVSLSLGQDRFSWTQMVAIAMICTSVYLVEIADERKNKKLNKSN